MPEIPPFSPGAYGFLPHSKMLVMPGMDWNPSSSTGPVSVR